MLVYLFLLITALSILFFQLGTGNNKRKSLLFISWTVCLSAIALAGVFKAHPPLFILVVFIIVIVAIYCYKQVKAGSIAPIFLLTIHILRIPVELVLYQLYLQKKIPVAMTFQGYNYDILTGLSAILILIYQTITRKQLSKTVIITWNIIGMTFLLTIVCIAFLSAPLPFQQFGKEQPNIALLEFPYCLLPGIVVPLVLSSHLLTLTKYKAFL